MWFRKQKIKKIIINNFICDKVSQDYPYYAPIVSSRLLIEYFEKNTIFTKDKSAFDKVIKIDGIFIDKVGKIYLLIDVYQQNLFGRSIKKGANLYFVGKERKINDISFLEDIKWVDIFLVSEKKLFQSIWRFLHMLMVFESVDSLDSLNLGIVLRSENLIKLLNKFEFPLNVVFKSNYGPFPGKNNLIYTKINGYDFYNKNLVLDIEMQNTDNFTLKNNRFCAVFPIFKNVGDFQISSLCNRLILEFDAIHDNGDCLFYECNIDLPKNNTGVASIYDYHVCCSTPDIVHYNVNINPNTYNINITTTYLRR